jgi:MoaA/NifB/PqqE/SkfB family radical SAM enzyme
MPVEKIQSVIDAGKKQDSYFYGILGGEPLMHKQLLSVFSSNPDCYFQLFTNGTLFDQDVARQLRMAGNVTPLFSFEGDEQVADIRRGGRNIYNRSLQAIRNAVNEKLITGVAISVCKSNMEMALSEEFVMMLHDMGVLYVWYYIYRPVGSQPNYELSLTAEDILRLRKFLVEGRGKYPMVLIDSYWKANGEPFCPAADGLSHHINAGGSIEPCPVIQFTLDTISAEDPVFTYEKSEWLRKFRTAIHSKTQGCVLMEDPVWLAKFAGELDAHNSSNRSEYSDSLFSAPEMPSHGSCEVIPEKNVLYRLAKKTAFFGGGAYG